MLAWLPSSVVSCGSRVFLGAAQDRLSILSYHRVLTSSDYLRPGVPTEVEFEWQMALISKYFNPMPLLEARQRLEKGTLPENAICVTFDDGYKDNLEIAAPILKKYSIPATFFIATGFQDGSIMWNDWIIESVRSCTAASITIEDLNLIALPLLSEAEKLSATDKIIMAIKYMPPDLRAKYVDIVKSYGNSSWLNKLKLMLSRDEVLQLHRMGFSIGGHTENHPILKSLDSVSAKKEIETGRDKLSQLLDEKIELFAYPNGKLDVDYSALDVELVEKAGFSLAVTTHKGVSTKNSDFFQLPRFTPWDHQPIKFLIRLLLNLRETG